MVSTSAFTDAYYPFRRKNYIILGAIKEKCCGRFAWKGRNYALLHVVLKREAADECSLLFKECYDIHRTSIDIFEANKGHSRLCRETE